MANRWGPPLANVEDPKGMGMLQTLMSGSGGSRVPGEAPPPELLSMLRNMSAQKAQMKQDLQAQAQPLAQSPPLVPEPEPEPESEPVPEMASEPQAEAACPPAAAGPFPPASAGDVSWSAQTSWVMQCHDGQGLQLVICEDDKSETDELALSLSASAEKTRIMTRLDPTPPGGEDEPCDMLLAADPRVCILRACIVSSCSTLQLFTQVDGASEHPLGTHHGTRLPGAEGGGLEVFVTRCPVSAWCSRLRIRLTPSAQGSMLVGRIVLRVQPAPSPQILSSHVPVPAPVAAPGAFVGGSCLGDGGDGAGAMIMKALNGLGSVGLDMEKVEALIDPAALSEKPRAIFESMKKKHAREGACTGTGRGNAGSHVGPPMLAVPQPPPPEVATESKLEGTILRAMAAMEAKLSSQIAESEQRLSERVGRIERALERGLANGMGAGGAGDVGSGGCSVAGLAPPAPRVENAR